jgi:hypothetical protein
MSREDGENRGASLESMGRDRAWETAYHEAESSPCYSLQDKGIRGATPKPPHLDDIEESDPSIAEAKAGGPSDAAGLLVLL